LMRDVALLGL